MAILEEREGKPRQLPQKANLLQISNSADLQQIAPD
jgi:hypothetical protein